MERGAFVKEGQMWVGAGNKYLVLVRGDYLGGLLVGYFRLATERDYTDAGRVRATVEPLEEE